MVELTLSILRHDRCRINGCDKAASVFGVCPSHEVEAVSKQFARAVQLNQCDSQKPPCFESDWEWRSYVVAFIISGRGGANNNRRPTVSYCRDCTPAFKQQMLAQGQCTHPETVFVRSERHNHDVIGVCLERNRKSTIGWESAIMGMTGEVVKMPESEVIHQTLTQIAEARKPKKRGPRFKKDRV